MNKDLEVYLIQTFDLAKSLIIKFSDIARIINTELKLARPDITIDETDPLTWKYYMNLNGEYYVTDTAMTVISVDTSLPIQFDKSTLDNNLITLAQYKTNPLTLRALIDRFPEQELLIRGILFPVDIQNAIDAEDGTILHYNKALVLPNEDNLLSELEEWVINALKRWSVRGFTLTDSYYLAANHAILYSNIVNKILNIRSKYSRTYQAHLFHIENFLKSHHNLGYLSNNLDIKSLLWLFRNLPYINVNVGKNEVLIDIIQNYVSQLNVDTKTYLLNQLNEPTKLGLPQPLFKTGSVTGRARTIDYFNIEEILLKETANKDSGGMYGKRLLEDRLIREEFKTSLTTHDSAPTKLLELSDLDVFKLLNINVTKLIIDTWVYGVHNNGYNAAIEFIDPHTSEPYVLLQEDALILYFNALVVKHNIVDSTITNWVFDGIVTPVIDIVALLDHLPTDYKLDPVLYYIIDKLQPLGNNLTLVEFNDYIVKLLRSLDQINLVITQEQSAFGHGILKAILKRMFIPITMELPYTNVGITTLYNRSIMPNIHVEDYDIDALMHELLLKATGYSLPVNEAKVPVSSNIINALNSITAYSTQKIPNTDDNTIFANLPINYIRLNEPTCGLFKPELISDCALSGLNAELDVECNIVPLDLDLVYVEDIDLSVNCTPISDIIVPMNCDTVVSVISPTSNYGSLNVISATNNQGPIGTNYSTMNCGEPVVVNTILHCMHMDHRNIVTCSPIDGLDIDLSCVCPTDGDVVINAPALHVEGEPNDVAVAPMLSTNAFSIIGSDEVHMSTDWIIEDSNGNIVWSSISDISNLTTIQIPNGVLANDANYTFRVRHKSLTYSSDFTSETHNVIVLAMIDAPLLAVEGEPNAVVLAPTMTTSAFNVSMGTDTHTSTDWVIEDTTGNVVWQSLTNTVNLTTITVPTAILTNSTIYTFRVRHNGVTVSGVYTSETHTTIALSVNAWSNAANYPMVINEHSQSTLIDGRVLVVGGQSNTGRTNLANTYNPTTDVWSSAANYPMAINTHSQSTLLDGRVLVVGGFSSGGYTNLANIYNPTTDVWSSAANYPMAIWYHTQSTLPDGRVLVVGGAGTSRTNLANIYDPVTDIWSSAANYPMALLDHTQSTLLDGRVLVVGGNGTSRTNLAHIYDPTTNAWTSAANYPTVINLHSQSTLLDGRVLVVGGQSNTGRTNFANIYDPATNVWSSAANYPMVIRTHPQSTLIDGRVLVVGGRLRTGTTNHSNIYTP